VIGTGPSGSGGAGHDSPGQVGGLASRDRGGRAYAAHWLGRDSLSLAARAVSPNHPSLNPAITSRVSGGGALESSRGPRLSERGALCSAAAGRDRLQRAPALERLGDGNGGVRQGR